MSIPAFVADTTEDTTQTVLRVTVQVPTDGDLRCRPYETVVTGSDVLITFDLQGDNWAFPASGAVVVTNGGVTGKPAGNHCRHVNPARRPAC